jgi:hypothetical protein
MAGKALAAELNPQPDKRSSRHVGNNGRPDDEKTTYQNLADLRCADWWWCENPFLRYLQKRLKSLILSLPASTEKPLMVMISMNALLFRCHSIVTLPSSAIFASNALWQGTSFFSRNHA